MSEQLNNSVLTAFEILSLFSNGRQSLTSQIVCKELGLKPITAHRFLRTLEVAGALVSERRGQYRLGLALAHLGSIAASSDVIARIAQPYLDDLASRFRETAIATTYRNNRMVVIASANSSRSYSLNMGVGEPLEMHCTANGKLWLASLTNEQVESFLSSQELQAYTPRTVVDAQRLKVEIEQVRKDGYSFCKGEREAEITAIGVPVLSGVGRMIAGISLVGANSHFGEEFTREALEALRKTAEGISASVAGESDSYEHD
ncbi:IclR family transcriptional regulator [Chelativorans alearense]|uniref:IclR family transcriptional regulator n=1 Tax=Chelativorans alearense TaxID=2681495 RepID=UPI0013D11A55|nr:IclR family transcriptional regulator [Chelativorans alearense]